MASVKRYGPGNDKGRITLSDYHQSKDALSGLPQTTAERIPVTSTPNIFSYKSYVFAKTPALIQRFIKATKADVGGVGGHVVAADEVKSVITRFVLENNAFQGEPIFTSLIVTHTGDDVAVTGIMSEKIDMAVVDDVPDGVSAVAKARELRPDVCLLDIRMPGLDGLEVTRALAGPSLASADTSAARSVTSTASG
jgi:CheY-like chemotaxis protein